MRLRRTSGQANSAQKHRDKRLLLVEDSRMFATALKHGLETTLGARVTHCGTLAAVKTELAAGPDEFSLAVVDLNLPDAPNCEALDFVLASNIPAIVFTGAFNDGTREQILGKDVLGCIVKHEPQSIERLIAADASAGLKAKMMSSSPSANF
ncbi:hypothetical protein QN226_28745, partial [Sinorhizobium sp. 6-117]|nr:hypothetical protein [Sinorhizobium sp. 6-117]